MTKKIINQENKLENLKTALTEESELKEKVKLLEAVVQKMFVNVIKLEAEVNNKKVTIKDNKLVEEANDGIVEFKSKQANTVREVGKCITHYHKSPTLEVKENSSKQNNVLSVKCVITVVRKITS